MDAKEKRDAEKLRETAKTGEPLSLALETDDRVLARVTDGIYRQPASAIRELIANAYDADATRVVVLTDAPRYSEILIRDNGNGMTAEVLINMIKHIGGSAKRTHLGQELGLADPQNPRLSKGGRKLIGKIGIGLFSVSQLTRQFTVITKPKDENYRFTAVVTLHRYTDESLADATTGSKFLSGKTEITAEIVGKDEEHGTTILLGALIPRAKHLLQSREMWSAVRNPDPSTIGSVQRIQPAFHSGLVTDDLGTYEVKPHVPWVPKESAAKRMGLLSTKLLEAANGNDLFWQLDHAFDYYFRMIWSLGLSMPLPYLVEHPFDLPGSTNTRCFRLSNKSRTVQGGPTENQVTELPTDAKNSIARVAKIEPPREGEKFRVEVDGLRLFRPIRFDVLQPSKRALQSSLMFVGDFKPDLSKFDKTQRGGQDLAFTGYFFWTPRIVPKEHNGLLIRINGASGTLFDSTFLNYQVSEKLRLKQIVAEVFVSEGLEEALNIDRESFNSTHPHYQILLNWVHNSLRQVFNKQKDLEKTLRNKRQQQTGAKSRSQVQSTRDEELHRVLGDDDDIVREVIFTDDAAQKATAEKKGARVYSRQYVIMEPVSEHAGKVTNRLGQRILLNEERANALVQLLEAYEVLDKLSTTEQRDLVRAILRIFNSGE